MCGIAGIYNITGKKPILRSDLGKMIDQLSHRGPDGKGYYTDEHIGLGHARLSIIDLNSGSQPIHNENKTIWVIFNGEIFNYIELRKDLEKKGHVFYTNTDTEVIVHLYEEYGKRFVSLLNGQFAIAVWDKTICKLTLVRDRVGIIPLFYTIKNNQIIFASEIKALLPVLGKSPSLNIQALDQIMTFWSALSPETIFQDIFEVSPGNLIDIKDGKTTSEIYWDWSFPENNIYDSRPPKYQIEELNNILIDATKIRLRSDVPVGAYLSGGLDSSVLVALIHHYGNVPLRTFSIGFDDETLDESKYQKLLTQHITTQHSHVQCTRKLIANNFLHTIWNTETPVLRTAPVPMMLLSNLVHQHGYKVVLTGEGSDEVFGGYDIFKETKIRQFWAKNAKSSFRPMLLKRLYPYLDLTKSQTLNYLKSFFGDALENPELLYFSHLPRWKTTSKCKDFFSLAMKSQLSNDAIIKLEKQLPLAMNHWHYFNKAQYLEAKSLMAGYLLSSQGDRMLMSNSVEGRFPFLDHRVIEFASKIHPKTKMKVLNEKYLLKQAMKNNIPEAIINRNKQPYRAPDIPSFFSEDRQDYVDELLSEESIRKNNYFDSKKVNMLLKKIQHNRAIGYKDNMALVGILSTQVWHHLFVENYSQNFVSQKSNENLSPKMNKCWSIKYGN